MASPILGLNTPLTASTAAPAVDPHTLDWLSSTSELLATGAARTVPAPDERQTLRDQFVAASEAVRTDESLPPELRLHLLTLVEQALWALDRVEIVGADAVMAVVDQMVVAGARLPKESSARGPLTKAVRLAWSLIEKTVVVNDLVQILSDMPQFPEIGA